MPQTEAWWFTAGEPLLLIEYQEGDIAGLPRKAQLVRTLEFANIVLSRCRVEYRSRPVGIWFLGINRDTDSDVLRRLRLHLVRLHSEAECLKQVFNAIIGRHLGALSNRSQENDNLQSYLKYSTRLLSQEESHGFRQGQIIRAAMEEQYLVEPNDREALLASLDQIRPNVLRSVKELTEQTVYVQPGGILNMENKTYKFSVSGTGNIVNVAEYMSNVTNTVNQNVDSSGAGADAKNMVKELMNRVREVSGSIDPELAKQLGDDVQSLSQEMTRKEPRKEWYQLTLNGLKKAAEKIGEIGAPIVAIASKLIPLLLGS
ncbi:MAG TPA: hypothetical protein VI386_04205 [Candidatus Sulfotelmatobacter sp.]